MTDDLLQFDPRSEVAKGVVHFAVGLTAGICGAYSACACSVRPTRRLALQTVFYGAIVFVEALQVFDHWHRR